MRAFLISQENLHDQAMFDAYRQHVMATLARMVS